MNINPAKLIYFSPTGTTKKILLAVAAGAGIDLAGHINLTLPGAKSPTPEKLNDDLAIIGCPVYGGRVPAEAVSRLRPIKGNGSPAVIVVVYGNRAYEDALVELWDLAVHAGFNVIAAGAFMGEHSYSTQDTPIAAGRPDLHDLVKAEEFGRLVHDKIRRMRSTRDMPLLRLPGNYPYKERSTLSNIAPVTQERECTKCETCASVCPVAAITVKESVITDQVMCIRCCACVKSCPAGARQMEDARIRKVAEQLSVNCCTRKDAETYL